MPSPRAPGPTAAPTTIPDNKLDAAAAAAKRVSAIRDAFDRKLVQAPAADKERLAGEADDAMKKAVTDQGLSIEEYTKIMEAAQDDPVVRNQLLRRLEQGGSKERLGGPQGRRGRSAGSDER